MFPNSPEDVIAVTGSSGIEALNKAETFQPEFIFMDLGMPLMSGYEACRRIREQPWGRQIKIVALSGWGQEDDRRRTKEAQFDEHVVKRIQASPLKNLLTR
jgi:CheY-like chemotaxis protein